MDVTAAEQAHLQDRLESTLGREATRTMIGTMVTKGDLAAATAELRDAIADCASKRDLQSFATKEDLDRFATKQDLQGFATKQDLDRFATKQDLQGFATKQDLDRFATKQDLQGFATKQEHRHLTRVVERIEDTLNATQRQVSEMQVQLGQALALGDKLRAEWKEDLTRYIGRQTVLQLGALLAIVIAAFTLAGRLAP